MTSIESNIIWHPTSAKLFWGLNSNAAVYKRKLFLYPKFR